MNGQLTLAEGTRLAELEAVVERGLQTFVEVGLALQEIRDERLYRSAHPTFEEYCRDRWGFSDRRARQLMTAAEIGTTVPVSNERQARELAPVLRNGGEDALARTWRRITDQHGSDVASGVIREHVRENGVKGREQLGAAARKRVWAKLIDLREFCDELPGLNLDRATAAANEKDVRAWLRIAGEAAATLSAFERELRQRAGERQRPGRGAA